MVPALKKKFLTAEVFNKTASAYYGEIGTDLTQFRQKMAGNEHGHTPLLLHSSDKVSYLDDALRIKTVYRFVKHHYLRFRKKRHSYSEALFHSE